MHAKQAKFGVAKITHELREKGVSQELIEAVVEQAKGNELDNAFEICRKKFKASPASREEWAKQARFLQSRGFGFEVIKKVLNSKLDDDDV